MTKSINIFGVGWPGTRPGHACLLELSGSIIKLQLEISDDTLSGLIDKIAKFMRDKYEVFPVSGIVGRKSDAELAFLKEHNRQPLAQYIVFSEAPNTETDGLIKYHFNTVLNAMLPDNKRLYLGPPSIVQSELMELQLPSNQAHKATDIDYPAVAALGYGVTCLLLRAGQLKRRRAKTNDRVVNIWTS